MKMKYERVLAPTDLSPFAEEGVRLAADLAHRLGATLTPLHVLSEDELEALASAHVPRQPVDLIFQDLEQQLRDVVHRAAPAEIHRALAVEPLVVVGSAGAEIVRAAKAKGMDLVVIATHGRTGLAHLLMGSVAEHVVRAAPCPVLTVRPAKLAGPERA